MRYRAGGFGAVRQPMTTITNHGAIYKMTLPEGFVRLQAPAEDQQNNYLECQLSGSDVRICYEETRVSLHSEDKNAMETLFTEVLPEHTPYRRLNLFSDPNSFPDDGAVYGALCQCFVFGGRLVRDGACIDEKRSTWELHTVPDAEGYPKNLLVGHLRFERFDGNPSNRRALLIVPEAPGNGGCGYIWLEGVGDHIRPYEEAFVDAVAEGEFVQL